MTFATLARRGNDPGCLRPAGCLTAQARREQSAGPDTLWTFASKLATVHHVAGQPGPLEHGKELKNEG